MFQLVHLRTFGAFLVTVGSPPQSVRVRAQSVRWLLAYLAAHGPDPIPREHVIRDLWPDTPLPRARRRLNHTIWLARGELGQHVILSEGDTLRLGENVTSDVQEFLSASRETSLPSLRRAADLYTGEFLPECYQDWAQAKRAHLHDIYVAVLTRLVRLLGQERRYDDAITYAHDLVRAAPLDEAGHESLIRLYLATGHPAQALRQYQRLSTLLRQELGVTPSPALQTLYERIRAQHAAQTSAPPFVRPHTLPLVGREEELGTFYGLLSQVPQGRGMLVLLEGDAGIGKTRLLQEVEEEAKGRGLNVVHVHARAATLYSPLADAIAAVHERGDRALLSDHLSEEIWRTLAHLVPSLGEPIPNVRPAQLHEAVVQFFAAAARVHPLLLILDDIHNVSPETLQILARLGRRIATLPLLLVLAYRPIEIQARPTVWEALQRLDTATAPRRLRLSPLSPEEGNVLIARALGVPIQHPVVRRLAPLNTGVPLYTLEMIRALHRRGVLQHVEGTWEVEEGEIHLPGEVYALVQERVQALPARERRTLEMLAVAGEFIPASVCLALGGVDATKTLRTLEQHGFLVGENNGYRFAHMVVHRATYDQIPERIRAHLHLHLAHILQKETPVPWENVAFHLEQGGRTHMAITAYLEAAQHAQQLFAHEQVVALCTRACRLVPPDLQDAIVCDLLFTRATSWFHQGDYGRARDDVARAISLARAWGHTDRLARLYLLAGQINLRQGRYPSARFFGHHAYRVAQTARLPEVAARALTMMSDVYFKRGHLDMAKSSAEEAYTLYEQAQSDAGKALVTYKLAVIAMEQGDEESAREAYRRVVEVARQAGDWHLQGAALNALGILALDRRETYRAHEAYTQALHIAERLGDSTNRVMTLHNLAVTALTAGRIGEAIRQSQAALEAAQEVGSSTVQVLSTLLLGNLYTICGRFEQAADMLTKAKHMAEATAYASGMASALRNLGILSRESGDIERAIELGSQALNRVTHLALQRQVITAAVELARTYLLADAPRKAEEVLNQIHVDTLPPMWQALVRAFLAQALALQNRVNEARAAVDLARPLLETRAADEYLAVAWFALARATERWDAETSRVLMARAYHTMYAQSLDLPPEWRESFLNLPLSHRRIVEAWNTRAPRPVVRLRITLPTQNGQGHREIVWTVDAGDADALVEARLGSIGLRRHRLRRLLDEAQAQGVRPSHTILAEVLGVSVGTIRRDLAALKASDKPSNQ